MSHGITLNFVSLAALAAALPHLSQTPGLVDGSTGNVNAGAATSSNVTTAHTAPTAAAAPVAAPAPKVEPSAPQAPSYTFDQVKAALTAYNQRDGAAFGAAMQKFGFSSFEAIAAAPGSWAQLMQYIGADTPAVEQPTFEKVASVLQTWAQANGAAFAAAMQAGGFTDLNAVKAAPGKWGDLLAAAKANGVS